MKQSHADVCYCCWCCKHLTTKKSKFEIFQYYNNICEMQSSRISYFFFARSWEWFKLRGEKENYWLLKKKKKKKVWVHGQYFCFHSNELK